jgi:hypothetical protein
LRLSCCAARERRNARRSPTPAINLKRMIEREKKTRGKPR